MKNDGIFSHTFDNGLVLVAESMPWLESVAFTFQVPAGCAFDPDDRSGLASFTCEMMLRGAGERDKHQFLNDLENLGVQRGEFCSDYMTRFTGATVFSGLPATMEIYADLLRRATLPADQLEMGRAVLWQELLGIEDDLQSRAMIELRKRHYPDPFGHPSQGDREGLKSITLSEIQQFYRQMYRPNGTLLGVAGKFDWEPLKDLIGSLFGDWPTQPEVPLSAKVVQNPYTHLEHESNQTHLALAYPSVPYRDEDFFKSATALEVLGGGMSGRLWMEVRERRGLCYAVYAMNHSLKDYASVQCYAGSSPDRAQETLDVTLQELLKLGDGITQEELNRVKVQYKTTLVMQQESSFSRSMALVRDWFHLGKTRTLDELKAKIDHLTVQEVNAFLDAHRPREFTIVSLGPAALEVPVGIS